MDTVKIPLSGGEFALVDADVAELVQQHQWRVKRKGSVKYAIANQVKDGKRTTLRMHRLILGTIPAGMVPDHINHNGLDNRRCNLRLATRQQNVQNRRKIGPASSAFKGVSWCKRTHRWRADIRHHRRQIFLGRYDSETEAARAYDTAALELFGDFACPNFPVEGR